MILYVLEDDSYLALSTDNIASIKPYDGAKIYLYDTKETKVSVNGQWFPYVMAVSSSGGGAIDSSQISDATTIGKDLLKATSASIARTAIGAGTSNLALGTTSTTAKAGNYQPSSSNITDATTVGKALLVATDASVARTAIGAGTSSLALATTAPSALGATASVGSATTASKADHVHAYPTASQVGASATSHTHTASNITDLATLLSAKLTATKGVAVADSTATDTEGVNAVLNALLASLRAGNIIA